MELFLGAHQEAEGATCVTAIIRDTSERSLAEDERRRVEQRLREAFENAPIGIVLSSHDGSITRVNDAFCSMTGHEAAASRLGRQSRPSSMLKASQPSSSLRWKT